MYVLVEFELCLERCCVASWGSVSTQLFSGCFYCAFNDERK